MITSQTFANHPGYYGINWMGIIIDFLRLLQVSMFKNFFRCFHVNLKTSHCRWTRRETRDFSDCLFKYRVFYLDWEKVLSFYSQKLLLNDLELIFLCSTMSDVFCVKI